MKAWEVSTPGIEEGCVIVHADTRGKAKQKGMGAFLCDFVDISARRRPFLDGKIITNDLLLEAGYPESWEGYPLDFRLYIWDCGCDLCKQSLAPNKEDEL